MTYAATIIADASFHFETKSAGYGYCISSHRGRKYGGGSFKRAVENTNIAEMMALVNALCIALNQYIVKDGEQVLMQTDSQASIMAFEGKRVLKHAQEQEAVQFFDKLVKERKIKVKFRHVKGHTGRTESRFLSNKLCDARARRGMEEARRKRTAQPYIDKIQEVLNGNADSQSA